MSSIKQASCCNFKNKIDHYRGGGGRKSKPKMHIPSLPAVMVQASVASMQNVTFIGEEYEKEQKDFLFIFLSAFFLLIPGLGDALDTAFDITAFSRMFSLTSQAGDAGLPSTSWSVIQHIPSVIL